MLALVRPDPWNLPLFLHVAGATILFGSTVTLALLGFASRRPPGERALWLRKLLFRVGLFVVLPSFVLMRAGGQWVDSKEYPHGHEPGWVGVGFAISDAGALVVLVLLILAWFGRRRYPSRAASVVPWLASLYVIALGAAWFAMSAKPGS